MKQNEQYAYFAVTDNFDPTEITARAGVPPTKSWRRGDICPPRKSPREFSRWCLESRLDLREELEAHVRDVLAQLDTNPDAFRAISSEFGGVMQLVGYFHREYPGLTFERDITEGLARYALAVDFDFYWFDLPSGEESE